MSLSTLSFRHQHQHNTRCLDLLFLEVGQRVLQRLDHRPQLELECRRQCCYSCSMAARSARVGYAPDQARAQTRDPEGDAEPRAMSRPCTSFLRAWPDVVLLVDRRLRHLLYRPVLRRARLRAQRPRRGVRARWRRRALAVRRACRRESQRARSCRRRRRLCRRRRRLCRRRRLAAAAACRRLGPCLSPGRRRPCPSPCSTPFAFPPPLPFASRPFMHAQRRLLAVHVPQLRRAAVRRRVRHADVRQNRWCTSIRIARPHRRRRAGRQRAARRGRRRGARRDSPSFERGSPSPAARRAARFLACPRARAARRIARPAVGEQSGAAAGSHVGQHEAVAQHDGDALGGNRFINRRALGVTPLGTRQNLQRRTAGARRTSPRASARPRRRAACPSPRVRARRRSENRGSRARATRAAPRRRGRPAGETDRLRLVRGARRVVLGEPRHKVRHGDALARRRLCAPPRRRARSCAGWRRERRAAPRRTIRPSAARRRPGAGVAPRRALPVRRGARPGGERPKSRGAASIGWRRAHVTCACERHEKEGGVGGRCASQTARSRAARRKANSERNWDDARVPRVEGGGAPPTRGRLAVRRRPSWSYTYTRKRCDPRADGGSRAPPRPSPPALAPPAAPRRRRPSTSSTIAAARASAVPESRSVVRPPSAAVIAGHVRVKGAIATQRRRVRHDGRRPRRAQSEPHGADRRVRQRRRLILQHRRVEMREVQPAPRADAALEHGEGLFVSFLRPEERRQN